MIAAALSIPRKVWWYMGALVGDHDYQRYVQHMKVHHPGCPIPSERQYWRDRYAKQDSNPGARCC